MADTGEHNQMIKALEMYQLRDGIGQGDEISGQHFLRHNLIIPVKFYIKKTILEFHRFRNPDFLST